MNHMEALKNNEAVSVLDIPEIKKQQHKTGSKSQKYDAGFRVTARSLYCWITSMMVTLFLGMFTILLALFRMERTIHKIASLWGNVCLKIIGVKVIVHGKENLYSGESSLIIANHQSICDIFIYYAILQKVQFRWMAKHTLFKIPIMGWAMSGAGYIPVNRKNAGKAKQSMYQAAEKIKSGKSVIIFPEGTTGNSDGSMIAFKKGAFLLAKKSGAIIQPISQFGAVQIVPEQNDRWMQRVYKGTSHVYIHKPVLPEEFAELSIEQLSELVRGIIEKPLLEKHLNVS